MTGDSRPAVVGLSCKIANMISEISGTFVKIAFADQVDILLKRNSPDRPAARYNREGQDALYLSVDENTAHVAMRKYVADSDSPRVLIYYEVQPCQLVDLRHPDAEDLRKRANQNWQLALDEGTEPTSWEVADLLRKSNKTGLIDPSRSQLGSWDITLFRWNEPDAPRVAMVGQAADLK